MGRTKITLLAVKKLLNYDQSTGLFTWKYRMASTVPANSIAGSAVNVSTDGYVYICLEGKRYAAHRLAWFFVFEVWPAGELDHIDRDKRNNRVTNLRYATRQLQLDNCILPTTHGKYIAGVNWYPPTKSFRVFHRKEFIGYYWNLLDAVAAKFRAIRNKGYSSYFEKFDGNHT